MWRVTRCDPPLATLEQLRDGTYGIWDLYRMHEVLDEEDEYRRRREEAEKRKARRR